LQIGTPQAATFQAQNVPFVGAQRRESEASNYERLAGSLGNFSSALSHFGKGYEIMKNKQEKENLQFIKDAVATSSMDPAETDRLDALAGGNTAAKAMVHASHAQKFLIPDLARREEEYGKELQANKWVETTNKPVTGNDGQPRTDEDGNQIMETRPITPKELADKYREENIRATEQFQGPDKAATRNALYAYNEKVYKHRLAELEKFRSAERRESYETTVLNTGSQALKQLNAAHKGDPDAITKGMTAYGLKMAKELSIGMNDADFNTKVMPRLLSQIAQEAEDDPELAEAALRLIKGKNGPMKISYLDHQKTADYAEQVVKAAQRGYAKRDFQNATSEMYKGLYAHLEKDNGHISQFKIPNIEFSGGGKTYKLTEKEIRDEVARTMDAKVLTVGEGRVVRTPTPGMVHDLAINQMKTGVLSPTLQGMLSDSSFTGDLENDKTGRLDKALVAYNALKKTDPYSLPDYFKGNTDDLKRLELTSALLDMNPNLPANVAARKVMDMEQAGGFREFKEQYPEKITAFEKKRDLDFGEHDTVLKIAYMKLMEDPYVTPEDVKEAIDWSYAAAIARKPHVNGTPIKIPRGVNPKTALPALTSMMDYAGAALGKKSSNLHAVMSANGTYTVFDKETKMEARNKDGTYLQFTYKQAEDRFQNIARKIITDADRVRADRAPSLQQKIDKANQGRTMSDKDADMAAARKKLGIGGSIRPGGRGDF